MISDSWFMERLIAKFTQVRSLEYLNSVYNYMYPNMPDMAYVSEAKHIVKNMTESELNAFKHWLSEEEEHTLRVVDIDIHTVRFIDALTVFDRRKLFYAISVLLSTHRTPLDDIRLAVSCMSISKKEKFKSSFLEM